MNLLNDSYEIISYMLKNKEIFYNSLNVFLLKNVRTGKEIADIKRVYILFFKHYYLYKKITKELLSKVTLNLTTYIGVSFLVSKYFKLIDLNEIIEFLKKALENNKEKYDDIIEQCLIDYSNNKNYTFKQLKKRSIEHLSILFNLPEWFIQMILNQQNSDIAKQVFESFNAKNKNYFLQSKLENLDDIDLIELKSFKKCNNNLYLEENGGSELIKKNIFIRTSEFFEYIFQNDLKQVNKYITLYQSEKGSFFYRFLNEYLYKNNVINLAFESFFENPDAIKNISPKQIKDLFIYESTVGQMIAHLNYKQDLIFYVPKSTNFEEFYLHPEYVIIFDQKNIDKLILNQKEGLNEISKHIAQNGLLVYVVETIDKKETSNVIDDFLKTDPEFELLKSEAIFPTNEKKIFGYYAILKRK